MAYTGSKALNSQGVKIKRGDGASTEVFTTIAEITDFSGPDSKASEIDCSNLESTAKEFRLGLVDNGNFQFSANLVPGDAAQDGLREDQADKTLRNFKVELTDTDDTHTTPTIISFAAFVQQFSIKGAKDGIISASISLRISGAVTWTAKAA